MLGRLNFKGTANATSERPAAVIKGIVIVVDISTCEPSGNTRDLPGKFRNLLWRERFLSEPWVRLDMGDPISFEKSRVELSDLELPHIFISIKVKKREKNI